MRIALVSPLMEAVPPRLYGGTERVVATLAEALSARGHHVTVFASGESRVSADLVVCRDRSLLTDDRLTAATADHIVMLDTVRAMADRFDVVHFHTEFLQFPVFRQMPERTLTTCHSRLDYIGLPALFRRYAAFPLVSISMAQRRALPEANWVANIPHGYPLDRYRMLPPGPGSADGDYLAFLGRIAPDKGIDTAIDIARAAGMKLKIAARINSFDRPYWEEVIAPRVDGHDVAYVGEIGDDRKSEFLSRARALVFPIRWPEPFGLVMIEAMACGTPVIAFPAGAVPEVIEDGLTGRIVGSVADAVRAVGEVAALDRAAIRARFEERFGADRMAARYIDVYRDLVRAAPRRRPSRPTAIERLTQTRPRLPTGPAPEARPGRPTQSPLPDALSGSD
jgi:glycosyltransferase involved in cell wall biosynthesis